MITRIFGTLSLCLLTTLSAEAQDPPSLYGVAHIRNDSTAQATTYYKWGKGPWKKIVIARGGSIAFAYQYDGSKKVSPELRVRIDVDTDGVKIVEHSLTRGQSPDDNSGNYGHVFAIKQLKGTDTRYIEAVTKGARVTITDAKTTKPEVK